MLAHILGLPFSIRVILGLIIAVVLLIILIRSRSGKSSARDSLDILREKWERGQISQEDYERARKKRGK